MDRIADIERALRPAAEGAEAGTETGAEETGAGESAAAVRTAGHRLLDLCLRFGVAMMEVGAEASRVEDSVVRILRAYGMEEASAFAIPTLFLVTFKSPAGRIYTSSRRIMGTGNNLHRLDVLNQLSRTLCDGEPKPLDFFEAELVRDQAIPDGSTLSVLAGTVLVAGGFAYIFGGGPADTLAAVLVSIVVRLAFIGLGKTGINAVFVNLLCSFLAGFGTHILARAGLGTLPDTAAVGVIMNLVPGMLITNSVREIMHGDYTSGLAKMTEALLTAVSLALGTGLAVFLLGGLS